MSYGIWKINENLTFSEFGYYSHELNKGSNKPVKCECETCGIIVNKHYRFVKSKHRCNPIIDDKKKCFKCKCFKLTEEFSKNRSNFDGYQKVCKECFSNYECVKKAYINKSNKLKTSLEVYLNNKISGLKRKCVLKNLPFNIEKGHLIELYHKQNGRCYYSDIEIKHNNILQYDSLSIERLNPEEGYVMGNVVLVSFSLNSFKGMMNEIEFKQFLTKIIPNLIEYNNK